MSNRKKAVFVVLTALFTVGVMELAANRAMAIYDKRMGQATVSFPQKREYYDTYLNNEYNTYDPDLGWDLRQVVRQRHEVKPGVVQFAASYGDSFTFAAEVGNKDSWQQVFQGLSGQTILNMGIPAAAVDQALLKIRKYHKTFPGRIVILGILPENINRLANVVRRFYLPFADWPFIKPRYQVTGQGIRLLPNPITKAEQLYQLHDPAVLEGLAAQDFWYHYRLERSGFNLVRGPQSPSMLRVLKLVKSSWRYGVGGITGYEDFFRDAESEPQVLLRYLAAQFKQTAGQLGFKPVVMLHCMRSDLGPNGHIKPFIRYLKKDLGMPVFNVRGAFRRTQRRRDLSVGKFFSRHGHYSVRGNRVVAKGLVRFFKRNGMLP